MRSTPRFELREEDDVADGFHAGEDDDQAVNADAHAAGGRHAASEGTEAILGSHPLPDCFYVKSCFLGTAESFCRAVKRSDRTVEWFDRTVESSDRMVKRLDRMARAFNRVVGSLCRAAECPDRLVEWFDRTVERSNRMAE